MEVPSPGVVEYITNISDMAGSLMTSEGDSMTGSVLLPSSLSARARKYY